MLIQGHGFTGRFPGELLVGPYSRYFWNHPGSLYIYLLVPFHALTGNRSEGLWAGALTLNLAALGVTFWGALRKGGSLLGVSIAALSGLFLWRDSDVLVNPWNLHVIVLPMMALVMVAAQLATGSLALLPAAALLATFVGQTHIGPMPVVPQSAALQPSSHWSSRAVRDRTAVAVHVQRRGSREWRRERGGTVPVSGAVPADHGRAWTRAPRRTQRHVRRGRYDERTIGRLNGRKPLGRTRRHADHRADPRTTD